MPEVLAFCIDGDHGPSGYVVFSIFSKKKKSCRRSPPRCTRPRSNARTSIRTSGTSGRTSTRRRWPRVFMPTRRRFRMAPSAAPGDECFHRRVPIASSPAVGPGALAPGQPDAEEAYGGATGGVRETRGAREGNGRHAGAADAKVSGVLIIVNSLPVAFITHVTYFHYFCITLGLLRKQSLRIDFVDFPTRPKKKKRTILCTGIFACLH